MSPDIVSEKLNNSIALDVSEIISEDCEDSDAFSPIKEVETKDFSLNQMKQTKDTACKNKNVTKNEQNCPETKTDISPTTSKLTENATSKLTENATSSGYTFSQTNNDTIRPTRDARSSENLKKQDTSAGAHNRSQDIKQDPVRPSANNYPSSTLQENSTEVTKEATPNTPSGGPPSMAFTVELETLKPSRLDSASKKKVDLSSSLSHFAPFKHKRNHSFSKVEKSLEQKPPPGRPRSGTVSGRSRPSAGHHHVTPGYHSEGYHSSDQDEDGPRKEADDATSRSAPAPDKVKSAAVAKKPASLRTRPVSPRLRPASPVSPTAAFGGTPLTESASVIIEKLMSTPEMNRKHYTPEGVRGRTCCRERRPSVSEITKGQKKDSKGSPPSQPCQEFSDDASETGTYTIDKDDQTGLEDDLLEGNLNNDRSKEVPPNSKLQKESSSRKHSKRHFEDDLSAPRDSCLEEEVASVSTAVPASTDVPHFTSDVPDSTDVPDEEPPWPPTTEMPLSVSRNSPNWIHEWAAQVAEQTKYPSYSSDSSLPVMSTPAKSSSLPFHSASSDSSRPRRKLPVPPPNLIHNRTPNGSYAPHLEKNTRSPPPPPPLRQSLESLESLEDGICAALKTKLRLTGIQNQREQNQEEICSSSSSEEETPQHYKEYPTSSYNNPPLKFNRAFSLRRARLECDEALEKKNAHQAKKSTQRPVSAGEGGRKGTKVPKTAAKSPRVESFERADGGRSSLRLAKNALAQPSMGVVKSSSRSSLVGGISLTPRSIKAGSSSPRGRSNKGGSPSRGRSNSTLSCKEVEFQNWKRRKNYDPMRAAAEGRRKQKSSPSHVTSDEITSGQVTQTSEGSQQVDDDSRSLTPPISLLRSFSFHGRGATPPHLVPRGGRVPLQAQEGPYSLDEDNRVSRPSHLPVSPPIPSPRTRRPSLGEKDSGICRKAKLDLKAESSSITSRKVDLKMEALDSLVVSTIHSLSVKVRTTSEAVLHKLKSNYDEDGDRAALLEEVLSHLGEEGAQAGPASRSTSRELAGVLRNLKAIQHALQVIDRVMIVGDDDDDSVPSEWVEESDY